MSEETSPSPILPPRRQWDGVAAVIAALVGLLALVVSAYTADVQRQQVRAQVWTRLFFGNSDVDRTLMVMNKGVGPASIQSVRVYVDGKVQADWKHIYAALGLPMPEQRVDSTLNGIVVAPNERINFVQFERPDDWAAFKAKAGRVKLRVCYCSVLDECLVFDERAVHFGHGAISSQVTPITRCDRIETEEFSE
ncbi:MAG: hypothetical protein ABI451_07910 [Dokdonella sp.]